MKRLITDIVTAILIITSVLADITWEDLKAIHMVVLAILLQIFKLSLNEQTSTK